MVKFLIEVGCLGLFFIGYINNGIVTATLYMLFGSLVGIFITYFTEKKVSLINIFSSGLLFISLSLTSLSGNNIFIKMKPTILYITIATIFLFTNFKYQPAIKYILGRSIILQEESSWYKLNTRFIFYFIMMAIINEIVWRNSLDHNWVRFKVFCTLPITMLFILSQVPFIIDSRAKHLCKKK